MIGRALATLMAVAVTTGLAQAAPRPVKVVDENNRGVESTILLNAGGAEWKYAASTGPDGSGTVDCSAGSRLKARPGDDGSYWDSLPQDCSHQKPLRVLAKPFTAGSAEIAVQELKLGDGRSWFMVLRPTLVVQQAESRTPGSGARAQCQIEVNATFQRQLYEETASGDWRPIDVRREAPTLLRPPASETLSSVVAPSGCAAATAETLTAQEMARQRLDLATSVAASWQTYGIAKTNPVDSVLVLADTGVRRQ